MEASDEDDSSSSDSEEDEEEKKMGGDLGDQFVIVDKDGGENKPLTKEEIKKLKRKTKLEKTAAIAAMALEEKEQSKN